MKSTFLAAVAAILVVQGVQAADYAMTAGEGYVDDAFTWQQIGKGYEFRWGVEVIEGRIAICGVGRFLSPHTRNQTKAVMRKARIIYGGKTILSDITFFNTVENKGPLEGQQATCRDTGVAAPQGKFDIHMEAGGTARF